MDSRTLSAQLVSEAAAQQGSLRAIRREIHRHPELGLQTPRTLGLILGAIEELGLEIIRSETISSAVVRITGDLPGSTVVLRADLDGLALQEDTGLEYASQEPGLMHACGHDLHAAIAVGAIRLLAAHRHELAGDVLFLLQPGEEIGSGADIMLAEGAIALAESDLVGAYALHVSTAWGLGQFVTKPGAFMAGASTLDVTVRGRGGHGSAPHLALDPAQALAEIVSGLQTMVTRRFSPFDPVIVTVGWLTSGVVGTHNVIPNTASLGATVRTFSPQTLAAVEQHSRTLVESIAAAYGLEADVTFHTATIPLINDPEHAELAQAVAVDMFGQERFELATVPLGGAEDFASVLHAVPGAFVFVGATPAGVDPATAPYNHSNLAVFDDAMLGDAAAYLAALALTRLARS